MLVKINEIENKPKRTYIYHLVSEGKLKQHIDKHGYVCYDTVDYENYKKTVKRGRPLKIKK